MLKISTKERISREDGRRYADTWNQLLRDNTFLESTYPMSQRAGTELITKEMNHFRIYKRIESGNKIQIHTFIISIFFGFQTAVNSARGTALLASNRLGTSFNETSNFSIFSFSLLTCKENIVEAKPEPYENMPIRLPSKESAPVLNE